MKRCGKCRVEKPLNEFYKKPNSKDGIDTQCKSCKKEYERLRRKAFPDKKRDYEYKRRFGISLAEYNDMLINANNVCEICNNTEVIVDHKNGRLRSLAVDHCHTTNKIRGLLCSSCNKALGKFKDDKQLLNKAVQYLEKYE